MPNEKSWAKTPPGCCAWTNNRHERWSIGVLE
jgi:hypothetical protein